MLSYRIPGTYCTGNSISGAGVMRCLSAAVGLVRSVISVKAIFALFTFAFTLIVGAAMCSSLNGKKVSLQQAANICQTTKRNAARKLDEGTARLKPDFGLTIVHLHYFETASMVPCELVVKRTNLAFLIEMAMVPAVGFKGLRFLVTISGDELPDVTTFYRSIHAPVPRRKNLFPDNTNVERVQGDATDLCPRAQAIQLIRRRRDLHPAYILFLNDGVRGPFGRPNQPSQDTRSGKPQWLTRFHEAFAEDKLVQVVGTTMSCEFKLHLQSYAIMVDWRQAHRFEQAYSKCCGSSKKLAIEYGEVGVFAGILDKGYRISSLWPDVRAVSQEDWECMRSHLWLSTWTSDVCKNPLATNRKLINFTVEDAIFAKYGGFIFRPDVPALPDGYDRYVYEETTRWMQIDTQANNGCGLGKFSVAASTKRPA